jgi:hypothetical protein
VNEGSSRLLHLSIKSGGGSCEHYYHFLLGYLLPLATFLARRKIAGDGVILLRSCGPLDRILREFAFPGLLFCERFTHAAIKERIMCAPYAEIVELTGFDFGRLPEDQFHYDIAGIRAGLDSVHLRLAEAIADAAAKIDAAWGGRPRVLMIERGEPDPFYRCSLVEHGNAANQRRFIANHGTIADAMSAAYPGFRNLQIETTPLAEQIAWFGLADIVVAQHGAALANIVWMREGTHVIEIAPDTIKAARTVFSKLAQTCGVTHAHLRQTMGAFGPAPVDDVIGLVEAAVCSADDELIGNTVAGDAFVADRRLAS